MPWRGASEPGEFPTLGFEVAAFIESHCVIPDGDHQGQPYILTNEMLWFLLCFYRLDPETGRFVYARGGQLIRPQKWGKGPFSAAIICAEAAGPVQPDGWNAQGEPVGRPWATPQIQVTAVSEDQTDNVWNALVPMIELGDLRADIPDTGQTRINLPGGGRIVPVTSSAQSRQGQPIVFALQDETGLWTKHNGGRKVADTQRRNVAGMKGRFLETTNAWDPTEESVAQMTYENDSKAGDVYIDDIDPGPGSIKKKKDRQRILKIVYGDSWWVDHERIDAEIVALLGHDPAQAERFFFNRKEAAEDVAFDVARWRQLADPDHRIGRRPLIAVGVDGARFRDALAIVATEIESGFQWPVGIWERPANADDEYEHPIDDVDQVMRALFRSCDVWRVYADPQYIEDLVDRWQGRWKEKRIVRWLTSRPKQTAFALRAYRDAMEAGDLSHDGDELMGRHIANARRREIPVYDDDRRPMWLIQKDAPNGPRKIDAAMAGCLSWEARGDAIAAGVRKRSRTLVTA